MGGSGAPTAASASGVNGPTLAPAALASALPGRPAVRVAHPAAPMAHSSHLPLGYTYSIIILCRAIYLRCRTEFAIMFYRGQIKIILPNGGGVCVEGRLLRDPGGARTPLGSLTS